MGYTKKELQTLIWAIHIAYEFRKWKALGTKCPSLEHIEQAKRILKELWEDIVNRQVIN